MTKLLTFIGFLVVLSSVMFLAQYKSLPVSNERFSYQAAKEQYHAKLEELDELERIRLARLMPPAEEEIIEEAVVLVELSTPQLQSGHDLYQRCIACHGRTGEGRLSQNSPAIGGQFDWYIVSSLKDMRDGRRSNPVMLPFVRNLSDSDLNDLAAYVSKLPWVGEQKAN